MKRIYINYLNQTPGFFAEMCCFFLIFHEKKDVSVVGILSTKLLHLVFGAFFLKKICGTKKHSQGMQGRNCFTLTFWDEIQFT